jgi:chaperonin GroES
MSNPSGITPVDLKVLVKPDPVEEMTKGGIILADTSKEKAKYAGTKATLVAIGPNAFKEWGSKNGLSVGDRVLFAQYSGARQKGADGEDYIIMNDQDIIFRLDKEANV